MAVAPPWVVLLVAVSLLSLLGVGVALLFPESSFLSSVANFVQGFPAIKWQVQCCSELDLRTVDVETMKPGTYIDESFVQVLGMS